MPHPHATPRDGEDNYLASLSDLMVGLLFVFILILMAFAFNLRQAEEVRTAQSAELKRVTDRLTDNEEVRGHLLRDVAAELEQRGVRVYLDEANGTLRLPEELLFPSGEAEPTEAGLEALRQLAATLARLLPCYARTPPELAGCGGEPRLEAVFIEGHTDDRPIHTPRFADNWALSAARALSTYRALVTAEPLLDRLLSVTGQPLLGVSAYEARRPVAGNDDEAGRRLNRRIDLRFLLAAPEAAAAAVPAAPR